MKRIKHLLLSMTTAIALIAPLCSAVADSNDQFIALPSYRVGPYGANGQAFYGGYVDYLNYVNLKEGGVNGVKLSWEECETEYNNAKGVECYERLKGKNPITKGTAYNVMATGIAYALDRQVGRRQGTADDGRLWPHRRGRRLGLPVCVSAGDDLPDAGIRNRQISGDRRMAVR